MPSQSNNSGKLLTTDGTNTSWTNDISFDNVTINSLKTDTINEKTDGSGVTIDGVLIKDNNIDATSFNNLHCKVVGNLENIGIGENALLNINSGSNNIAIGNSALKSILNDSANIAIGRLSQENTTNSSPLANNNISIGIESMYNNTSGRNNTVIGGSALFYNTTGSANVAIGQGAGNTAGGSGTTPNESIFIGTSAHSGQTNSTNEIVIGHNTTGNGSNTVTIGNSSVTASYLKGTLTINGAYTLPNSIGTAGQMLKVPSSGTSLEWGTTADISGDTLTNITLANTVTLYGSTIFSNWVRINGVAGLYFQTYGGGWYMTDNTWIRSYGNKPVYVQNEIAAGGNITAYYSDERLKEKLGIIENAVNKIKKIETFYYKENTLAKTYGFNNSKKQIGLSAQSVEKVLPECVSLSPFDYNTLEDGSIISKSGKNYLTVDYSKIVPLLIEGIKEQQSIIETQNTKINNQELKINDLESKINNLESKINNLDKIIKKI